MKISLNIGPTQASANYSNPRIPVLSAYSYSDLKLFSQKISLFSKMTDVWLFMNEKFKKSFQVKLVTPKSSSI